MYSKPDQPVTWSSLELELMQSGIKAQTRCIFSHTPKRCGASTFNHGHTSPGAWWLHICLYDQVSLITRSVELLCTSASHACRSWVFSKHWGLTEVLFGCQPCLPCTGAICAICRFLQMVSFPLSLHQTYIVEPSSPPSPSHWSLHCGQSSTSGPQAQFTTEQVKMGSCWREWLISLQLNTQNGVIFVQHRVS